MVTLHLNVKCTREEPMAVTSAHLDVVPPDDVSRTSRSISVSETHHLIWGCREVTRMIKKVS